MSILPRLALFHAVDGKKYGNEYGTSGHHMMVMMVNLSQAGRSEGVKVFVLLEQDEFPSQS